MEAVLLVSLISWRSLFLINFYRQSISSLVLCIP